MLKQENRRAGVNVFNFEAQKDLNNRVEQENRVKTEMCRNWETGICEYGEKCFFAHGKQELREKAGGKMVKVQKCENYFKFGYCISGSKCQFSHSQEIRDGNSVNIKKLLKISDGDQITLPVFIDLESRSICRA